MRGAPTSCPDDWLSVAKSPNERTGGLKPTLRGQAHALTPPDSTQSPSYAAPNPCIRRQALIWPMCIMKCPPT